MLLELFDIISAQHPFFQLKHQRDKVQQFEQQIRNQKIKVLIRVLKGSYLELIT